MNGNGGGCVGVCIGASTISLAERANGEVRFKRVPHEGRVRDVLAEQLRGLLPANVGFTGRKFRKFLAVPSIPEPEAIELACRAILPRLAGIECIVSLGGETFIAYVINRHGEIRNVHSGNKCAAGTGEFFLQQIHRMGLGVEEAIELALNADPYQVAGRCSVFCKTDCTHALNKGIDKGRVAAGLCRMIAEKIADLVRKCRAQHVLVVGGVSRNPVVVSSLRQAFQEVRVPPEAPYFEALGALLWAEANANPVAGVRELFQDVGSSFEALPSLGAGAGKVAFLSMTPGVWHAGDYVLGLDVGSTTTKAVVVRCDNAAVTASVYLRTSGDPVGASRDCYRRLLEQFPQDFRGAIIGLGVTGSGRRIAGLHAGTQGVINEIVAHATAAAYFDPEVETIFEIGGQDAKYTWLTNRVASDYAMNEACSAGTGSFLEESCGEMFDIPTVRIADIALAADRPLNFRDQCAAFIGSDISSAIQEGSGHENIVAGLVYSVCQNYLNRVKGTRPAGRKIFMQGGVCYNRAVPLAMANLCGEEIVVPPEPGLMGAFGAALEIRRNIELGLLPRGDFTLSELAARAVAFGEPFTCAGGKDGCDRKCGISRVLIDGQTHPFGGACNLYENLRNPRPQGKVASDLVLLREKTIWQSAPPAAGPSPLRIGIPASLFAHSFYPLYADFFSALGHQVVTTTVPDREGMNQSGATFCQPVLQGHGFVKSLLDQRPDLVFIPQVQNPAAETYSLSTCACPFVQCEPYYMQAAFHRQLAPKLLSAILDFSDPEGLARTFVALGVRTGASRGASRAAFATAWKKFQAMREGLLRSTRDFLRTLHPDATAIVLFGRPYNAFTHHGNMGIPQKFTSRGYSIIPCDLLPQEEASTGCDFTTRMFWAAGQVILNAAAYVHNHPALFATYITNFSCGPDSFLLGYFREIMGNKPALVLELDAHTADAGVDTRIEAFLDVIKGYRRTAGPVITSLRDCVTEVPGADVPGAVDGTGPVVPDLAGEGVRVLVPSMGETTTRAFCGAFRYAGIRADALPPPGSLELNLGQGESTCKECLPLQLNCGSVLRYFQEHPETGERRVLFMPEANGPCRFGQYVVFLRAMARRKQLDLAFLSPAFENGYAGVPRRFFRRAWLAICIGDALDDLSAAILALARDPDQGLARYEASRERILAALEKRTQKELLALLRAEMLALATLERRQEYASATRVLLTGEIYVRRDGFSRQNIVERLAGEGIVVRISPLSEWILYSNYCALYHSRSSALQFGERTRIRVRQFFMRRDEKAIRKALGLSGFCSSEAVDVPFLMERSERLIDPSVAQETNLTISATISEIGDDVHGVINIGPFGCMPCRVAESIIVGRMQEEKAAFSKHNRAFWRGEGTAMTLPFLTIEVDGNAFPQMIEARLESFVLATHRLKGALGECGRQLH